MNKKFVLGSIALGFLIIPCLVWVALGPVIIVANAKRSVIEYGLWQVPIFGACILGNWILYFLSYRFTPSQILVMGSFVCSTGLLLLVAFPLLIKNDFRMLIPGLIFYFCGMGMTNAPLIRKILFSTSVSKGTASALMTLIEMGLLGVGIAAGNWVYQGHNNWKFGLYCALIGLLYVIVLALSKLTSSTTTKPET